MAQVALAISALLLVCLVAFFAISASSAFADAAPLTVTVDHSLSLVGQRVTVTVSGQLSQSLLGTKLLVSLRGPVSAAQVGGSEVDAATVKALTVWLGTAPVGGSPAGGTATTLAGSSTAQQLAAGTLQTGVTLSGRSPSVPGAYLVSAEVRSGSKTLASGGTWLGKAAARDAPLDVSLVLPVSLGIHRDPTGKFFDSVLDKATLPAASGMDTLRGLTPLADRLSQLRFTLAVEPVLLTQLRAMADGYDVVDAAGHVTRVDKSDLAAQNAAATIADLAGLVTRDSVEVVASPYTGADLGLLSAQGWRDGLEQIQMGKQELQSTLGLDEPLSGAYAPDLSVTGAGLACYADASIDQVVVGSQVLGSFAEQVAPGTVAVRAENTNNDRVTLVFGDSLIGDVMRSPWDANVFSAALAAELAASPRNAVVIAPEDVFGLMPLQYVQNIGEILTSQTWIRTQKLEELVSLHSPESRPVLLEDSTPQPADYIEGRLLDAVREAHAPVSDLAAAADTTKTAVDSAYQLLYAAESRWWSRPGASPQQASMGLAYARQAEAAAKAELAKVRFVRVDSPLITKGRGSVRLTIDNAADYQVAARLRLVGEGVSFPDGDQLSVTLQPGRTVLDVKVTGEGGPQSVAGSLIMGTTVVDEFTHTVRFLGLWSILPWVLTVAGLLAIGGGYLLARRYLRKRRSAQSGQDPDRAQPAG